MLVNELFLSLDTNMFMQVISIICCCGWLSFNHFGKPWQILFVCWDMKKAKHWNDMGIILHRRIQENFQMSEETMWYMIY